MMMITHIFNDDSPTANLSKNKIIHRKEEMSDVEKFEKSNSRSSGFGNIQERFLTIFRQDKKSGDHKRLSKYVFLASKAHLKSSKEYFNAFTLLCIMLFVI